MKKILISMLLVLATLLCLVGCGGEEPARYTVTFDSNGGSEVNSQTVTEGNKATMPEAPTKDGFTFGGWYIGEAEYDFNTAVTEDITLTAKWTENVVTPPANYTVTFDTNGGSEVVSQTVTEGGVASIPEAPTKDGYTFVGWYIGETEYDFNSVVTEDITLTAKWTENVTPPTTYTVTFDSNGGSGVASQTVTEGNKATMPEAPTKDGFTFDGWYLGDAEYDFNTAVTEDITLTAKWTENVVTPPANYTVTFDSNGGSEVASQTVTEGNKAVMPEAPTKDGFTFDGWYLGDAEYDFNTAVTEDITLTAKWTENVVTPPANYTVTFDTNGGSEVASQTVTEGNKATMPEAPTKDGYTFVGWYLGDAEYDFNTVVTEDITLTAKWTVKICRVTFDSDGGSEILTVTVNQGSTVAKPLDPEKNGFAFAGWYLNGELFDFDSAVNSSITLVAKWTVDFSAIAGTWRGNESIPPYTTNQYEIVIGEDGSVTASYFTGYTDVTMTVNSVSFDGVTLVINYTAFSTTKDLVFTISDDGGSFTTPSAAASASLTIYKTYSVKFDFGEYDKDPVTESVNHGDTLPERKQTWTGHTLDAWLLDGEEFDFRTPITSDITLVAKWSVKVSKVTFFDQDGNAIKEIEVEYNHTVLQDEIPTDGIITQTGYTFNGRWYTSASANSPVKFDNTKITSDKTYHPGIIAPMDKIEGNWNGANKNGVEYKMTIDSEGASVKLTVITGGVSDEVDVTVIIFKDFSGTTKLVIRYIASGNTSETVLTLTYTKDGTFTGSNSLVLTKEGQITYTVSFDTDGGNEIGSQIIAEGGVATMPKAPTKDGFAFAGWLLDGEPYDFDSVLTSDITLTAKWATAYTVTFDTGNSATTSQVIVAEGMTVTPPEKNPSKTNYVFVAWLLDGEEFDFSSPISESIVLTPLFRGKDITLTFYNQNKESVKEVTVEYGTELDPQEIPEGIVNDGYIFTGVWHKSGSLTAAPVDLTGPITSNQSLYPGYVHYSIENLDGTWYGYTDDGEVYTFDISVDSDFTVTATVTVDGMDEAQYEISSVQFDGEELVMKYFTEGSTTAKQFKLTYDSDTGDFCFALSYSVSIPLEG